jgi:hypothetical protein
VMCSMISIHQDLEKHRLRIGASLQLCRKTTKPDVPSGALLQRIKALSNSVFGTPESVP